MSIALDGTPDSEVDEFLFVFFSFFFFDRGQAQEDHYKLSRLHPGKMHEKAGRSC